MFLTNVAVVCFQPIFANIQADDDVKKTERLIANGMSTNAQNLQNYLSTWDNYR